MAALCQRLSKGQRLPPNPGSQGPTSRDLCHDRDHGLCHDLCRDLYLCHALWRPQT